MTSQMESLADRTRLLIREDRTKDIRRYADLVDKYCFHASIWEIAANLGTTNIPRTKEALARLSSLFPDYEPGYMSEKRLFQSFDIAAKTFDLEISRILIWPAFLFRCNVPASLSGKVVKKSNVEVDMQYPCIRVMVDRDVTITHCEADFNLPHTQSRIEEIGRDMPTCAAIEFKKAVIEPEIASQKNVQHA